MMLSSDMLKITRRDLQCGSIGDYMLKSMREQRKTNTLCDAIVKCEEKEYHVHRSVMFAHSLYCRTLFTSLVPSELKDGKVIIDLNSFSDSVVAVFLDILYGDVRDDCIDVSIEELLKLSDFLQAESDIQIITAIVRKQLDISNCLEIYKLAGTYHFHKLQTIALTYISNNLDSLIKSDGWKGLDGENMLSILKSPIIQCRPEKFIGGVMKSYFSESNSTNMLMSINGSEIHHSGIEVCCHDNNKKAKVTNSLFLRHEDKLTECELYFVFQQELYCIHKPVNEAKDIFKYSQYLKKFIKADSSDTKLENLDAALALIDEDNDDTFTVLCFPAKTQANQKQFALVTYIPHSPTASKKSIAYVSTSFKVDEFYVVWNPRSRKIFFLSGKTAYIFNMESKNFQENQETLNSVLNEKIRDSSYFTHGSKICFTVFKGCIYAIECNDTKLKLYTLNEDTLCWDIYLESEMNRSFQWPMSCSSSTELVIILQEKNRSETDHIYKLNPESKDLTLLKTVDPIGVYLFVPNHITY